ncbi:MAG: hypothetical protein GJT30_09125 [Geobacter sp.]|nr:hypothetical protein [Geobacter sp.]
MRSVVNTIIQAMSIIVVPAAFAASGAREDSSNLFVWIFLGMCALIVVVQLFPAIMMIVGFASGVKKSPSADLAKESAEQ